MVRRIINVPRRGIGTAALDELRAEAQQRELSLFAVVLDPQTLSLRTRAKFAPFAEIMETAFGEYGQRSFAAFAASLLKRIGYEGTATIELVTGYINEPRMYARRAVNNIRAMMK